MAGKKPLDDVVKQKLKEYAGDRSVEEMLESLSDKLKNLPDDFFETASGKFDKVKEEFAQARTRHFLYAMGFSIFSFVLYLLLVCFICKC